MELARCSGDMLGMRADLKTLPSGYSIPDSWSSRTSRELCPRSARAARNVTPGFRTAVGNVSQPEPAAR